MDQCVNILETLTTAGRRTSLLQRIRALVSAAPEFTES